MRYLYGSECLLNILKALFFIGAATHILQDSNTLFLFGLTLLFEVFSSVVAPFSVGVFIDKKGGIVVYKRLMLILMALLCALWGIHPWLSPVVHLFLAYSCLSFFAPLQRMAQQTYFAEAREQFDLKKVNAHHQMAVQAGQLIGLGLSVMLVDAIDFSFLHLGGLTCLALAFACAARLPSLHKATHHGQLVPFRQLIRSFPLITKALIVVSAFDYVVMSVFNLSLPVLAQSYAQKGQTISYFDMAYAAGAICLSWGLPHFFTHKPNLKLSQLAYVLLPFLFVGLVLDTTFIWRMVLIFSLGVLLTVSTIGFNSHLQATLPKEVVGRVFALRRIVLGFLLLITINGLSWQYKNGLEPYYFTLCAVIFLLSIVLMTVLFYKKES